MQIMHIFAPIIFNFTRSTREDISVSHFYYLRALCLLLQILIRVVKSQ